MSTNVQKHYLDQLRQLLLQHTKDSDIKILLFGSHAKGTSRRFSDIDIALLATTPLPLHFISNLNEVIEKSNIPYTVDLIDLSECNNEFRQKILNEGVIWKD